MNDIEINSDGRTVWVNDPTGMCIGRFSWAGVDVHATGSDQMKDGAHCLDCVGGLQFDEMWDRFRASMLQHHGVEVPEKYKPTDRGDPEVVAYLAELHAQHTHTT